MHVGEGQRHEQAMIAPRGLEEEALVGMIRGVEAYATLLSSKRGTMDDRSHESLVQALGDIIDSIADLSDGPRGRLDQDRLTEKLAAIAGRELPGHAGDEAGLPRSARAHLKLLQNTSA